jgi:hypothetical protein
MHFWRNLEKKGRFPVTTCHRIAMDQEIESWIGEIFPKRAKKAPEPFRTLEERETLKAVYGIFFEKLPKKAKNPTRPSTHPTCLLDWFA